MLDVFHTGKSMQAVVSNLLIKQAYLGIHRHTLLTQHEGELCLSHSQCIQTYKGSVYKSVSFYHSISSRQVAATKSRCNNQVNHDNFTYSDLIRLVFSRIMRELAIVGVLNPDPEQIVEGSPVQLLHQHVCACPRSINSDMRKTTVEALRIEFIMMGVAGLLHIDTCM